MRQAPITPLRGSRHEHGVRLGNITIMPASSLPFKHEWQAIARGLPKDGALLLVPQEETSLKRVLRCLVPQFRAQGRGVVVVDIESRERRQL